MLKRPRSSPPITCPTLSRTEARLHSLGCDTNSLCDESPAYLTSLLFLSLLKLLLLQKSGLQDVTWLLRTSVNAAGCCCEIIWLIFYWHLNCKPRSVFAVIVVRYDFVLRLYRQGRRRPLQRICCSLVAAMAVTSLQQQQHPHESLLPEQLLTQEEVHPNATIHWCHQIGQQLPKCRGACVISTSNWARNDIGIYSVYNKSGNIVLEITVMTLMLLLI